MKIQLSRRSLLSAALIGSVCVSGCSSIIGRSDPLVTDVEKQPASNVEKQPASNVEKRTAPFELSRTLISQGQYEAAYNENQRILQEARGAPDVALFNLGMISAHSANPKKNYPRALSSFRTLVKDYPQSEMLEPAKTWIKVLEEHQKVVEEKRTLTKGREALVQEKDKLKYAIEKSRQIDIEIEKKRRETLQK